MAKSLTDRLHDILKKAIADGMDPRDIEYAFADAANSAECYAHSPEDFNLDED